MFGVILADAWIKTPFMTIFILAAMDGIDQELYETAVIGIIAFVRISVFATVMLLLMRREY